MTTLTLNIQSENDLVALEETLNKLGLSYHIDNDKEFTFTQDEINGFVKTRQDFVDGKTTARNWEDIEKDLDSAYN